MLILTRKINQKILVVTKSGEEIEIVIVQIKGRQTRIGVNAPADASIRRGEIFDKHIDDWSDCDA